MILCDTSAIAKLYVPEYESHAVRRLLENEDEVCVSALARPELMGVFHRRLHERKWTQADFHAAVRQFSQDDTGGFWTWLPLSQEILRPPLEPMPHFPTSSSFARPTASTWSQHSAIISLKSIPTTVTNWRRLPPLASKPSSPDSVDP